MSDVQDEVLMRITAQFVSEQEAGRQPRLDDYMRRYPRYANEIADFVTYYYALEANLPKAAEAVPQLSANSLAALKRTWERAGTSPVSNPAALLALARRRRYTLAQLATKLDLSTDLVEQLAQCQFDPITIPNELLQRLAHVLGQSLGVVRRALGVLESSATRALAEKRATYALPTRHSFRQALLASTQVSPAQKEQWQIILEDEGL